MPARSVSNGQQWLPLTEAMMLRERKVGYLGWWRPGRLEDIGNSRTYLAKPLNLELTRLISTYAAYNRGTDIMKSSST